MSSLDYWLLLIQASIYANKEYYYDIMNKFRDTLASIHEKFIEIHIEKVDHIFHHIRFPFPNNDVEDN